MSSCVRWPVSHGAAVNSNSSVQRSPMPLARLPCAWVCALTRPGWISLRSAETSVASSGAGIPGAPISAIVSSRIRMSRGSAVPFSISSTRPPRIIVCAIRSLPVSKRCHCEQNDAIPAGLHLGDCVVATLLAMTPQLPERASVRGEAVEQAVAAGRTQIGLAAAALGAVREVRRIPGMRRRRVVQARAVDMAEHSSALRAARPVLAGLVLARRKGAAVRHRAGQRVVLVGRIAAAIDDVALLGQRGLLCQIVLAMQFVDILGDNDALGILPRTLADAVARIDCGFAVGGLGAEIGMPGSAARAGRLRQLLTVLIGAVEPAEIGTLADWRARHTEAHVGCLPGSLCVCRTADRGRRERDDGEEPARCPHTPLPRSVFPPWA